MKSYTHFTLSERESLQLFLQQGISQSEIARRLGKHKSSISREIKRNKSKKKDRYNAWHATTLYIHRRKSCVRKYKIKEDSALYEFILKGLEQFWSPEQISGRGKLEGFNISYSTIYLAIKRGVFEGVTPRTHLRRRGKHKSKESSNSATIKPKHTIHEYPDVIKNKGRIGDFEGDTVYGGVGKGCIATFVCKKSKVVIAALSQDRSQENIRLAIKNAFKRSELDIPVESITFDRGSEFAAFEQIEEDLGCTVYFADPHSPWQRGLNENTNDIIRFFYPKGTDFREVTDEDLQAVVDLINNRPRKTLDYLSPLEFLSKKCCT